MVNFIKTIHKLSHKIDTNNHINLVSEHKTLTYQNPPVIILGLQKRASSDCAISKASQRSSVKSWKVSTLAVRIKVSPHERYIGISIGIQASCVLKLLSILIIEFDGYTLLTLADSENPIRIKTTIINFSCF